MKHFRPFLYSLSLVVVLIFLSVPLHAQKKSDKTRISPKEMKEALMDKPSIMPFVVNGVKFEMVLVQGGSYMMGCEPPFWGNAGRNDEIPRHGVRVNSFYLGRYEVTQRLWEAVMGENPSNFKGDDFPVEQVSYLDVQLFISRLNQLTGKQFRLPTEAEWEYAARGGNLSEGHLYSGNDKVEAVGWAQINSEVSTHNVGELAPNELGLYDMTGNVWEWCNDWYAEDAYLWDVASLINVPATVKGRDGLTDWMKRNYYDKHLRETTLETPNPKGPADGIYRVGRGGSWTDEADGKNGLRMSYRNFWVPSVKLSVLGFRLALSENEVPLAGWMPNQYVLDSSDGRYYATSPENMVRATNGALEGLFSVGEKRRVRFSRGNLQYNAVSNSWRFADNQYDIIGENNTKNSKKYAGWIDLFAWATSGYRDHYPYYFAMVNSYYGNGEKNIDGTSYDWGIYNAISNGGNRAGRWRTLSVNEWAYLLMRRPGAFLLSYSATVENRKGMVLLPDDFYEHDNDTIDPTVFHLYDAAQWRIMERAGAVFLPCAGYSKIADYHYGNKVEGEIPIEGFNTGFGILVPESMRPASAKAPTDEDLIQPSQREFIKKCNYRPSREEGALGYYWTTIHYEKKYAMGFCFDYGSWGYILPLERLTRLSVRLVQDE